MDITLERILSLIPKKPDGKYVHGAKAEFARSLGFADTASISMWESGKNWSYRNYLYEISEKYNVSVEWLKGETDIKEKKAAPDVGNDFLNMYSQLTPQNRDLAQQVIERLLKAQGNS